MTEATLSTCAENFNSSVGSLGGTIDTPSGESDVATGLSDTSARSIHVVDSESTRLLTARRATATSMAVRFDGFPPVEAFAPAPRRRPTRQWASGISIT